MRFAKKYISILLSAAMLLSGMSTYAEDTLLVEEVYEDSDAQAVSIFYEEDMRDDAVENNTYGISLDIAEMNDMESEDEIVFYTLDDNEIDNDSEVDEVILEPDYSEEFLSPVTSAESSESTVGSTPWWDYDWNFGPEVILYDREEQEFSEEYGYVVGYQEDILSFDASITGGEILSVDLADFYDYPYFSDIYQCEYTDGKVFLYAGKPRYDTSCEHIEICVTAVVNDIEVSINLPVYLKKRTDESWTFGKEVIPYSYEDRNSYDSYGRVMAYIGETVSIDAGFMGGTIVSAELYDYLDGIIPFEDSFLQSESIRCEYQGGKIVLHTGTWKQDHTSFMGVIFKTVRVKALLNNQEIYTDLDVCIGDINNGRFLDDDLPYDQHWGDYNVMSDDEETLDVYELTLVEGETARLPEVIFYGPDGEIDPEDYDLSFRAVESGPNQAEVRVNTVQRTVTAAKSGKNYAYVAVMITYQGETYVERFGIRVYGDEDAYINRAPEDPLYDYMINGDFRIESLKVMLINDDNTMVDSSNSTYFERGKSYLIKPELRYYAKNELEGIIWPEEEVFYYIDDSCLEEYWDWDYGGPIKKDAPFSYEDTPDGIRITVSDDANISDYKLPIFASMKYQLEPGYIGKHFIQWQAFQVHFGSHQWSSWTTISKATVDAPELQERICKECGERETRNYGNRLVQEDIDKITISPDIREQLQIAISNREVVPVGNTMPMKAGSSFDANVLLLQMLTQESIESLGLTVNDLVDILPQKDLEILMQTHQLTNTQAIVIAQAIKGYTSSNIKTATVSTTGKVSVKGTEAIQINAKLANGKQIVLKGKGQRKTVATKTLKLLSAKSVPLKKGQTTTVSISRTPYTTTDKLSFKSSNKKVATVNSKGVVTAKKKGKATITVSSGKKKVKVTVKVSA